MNASGIRTRPTQPDKVGRYARSTLPYACMASSINSFTKVSPGLVEPILAITPIRKH